MDIREKEEEEEEAIKNPNIFIIIQQLITKGIIKEKLPLCNFIWIMLKVSMLNSSTFDPLEQMNKIKK